MKHFLSTSLGWVGVFYAFFLWIFLRKSLEIIAAQLREIGARDDVGEIQWHNMTSAPSAPIITDGVITIMTDILLPWTLMAAALTNL